MGNLERVEIFKEDIESEHESKLIRKLRIVAIIVIVLCAGSIIFSAYRRNAHKHEGTVEEHGFFSDDEIISNESADTDQIQINNENHVNSNKNKVESEPIDQNSTGTDGENDNCIDESEVNINTEIADPPLFEDRYEGADIYIEQHEDINGEVDMTNSSKNKEEVNTVEMAIEVELIDANKSKLENDTTIKVENLKPESKIKIYESEFEDLEAEDSEEEIGEIEEIATLKSVQKPSGRLFYESSDGQFICIFSRELGRQYVASLQVDFELIPLSSKFSSISFTSDHKTAAFALIDDKCRKNKKSKIIVKNSEELTKFEICGGKNNNCYDPHISPDGKYVIYRKGDWKELYYYNLETRIETKLDLPSKSFKYKPNLFSDSKRFVFVALLNRKFKIIVSNLFDTRRSKCIHASNGVPKKLAISPDGRYIAFNMDNLIHVVAVNDKERHNKNFKFGMPLPTANDAIINDYYSGIQKRQVKEIQKFSRPFWSPDGKTLFFASPTTAKVYYTGYGFDKWKVFDAHFRTKYYGIIAAEPVMRTNDFVKSALDNVITQVEALNS